MFINILRVISNTIYPTPHKRMQLWIWIITFRHLLNVEIEYVPLLATVIRQYNMPENSGHAGHFESCLDSISADNRVYLSLVRMSFVMENTFKWNF